MVKSKGLGKGLSALLGDNNTNSDENIVDLKNFKSDKTPIHKLVPNKFQPRKNFDKKQLDELAASTLLYGRRTNGWIYSGRARDERDPADSQQRD